MTIVFFLNSDAQFSLSTRIYGNYNVANSYYFRVESGIAPELFTRYSGRQIGVGLRYQRISWFLDEEYVASARTHLFEFSIGLLKSIKKKHPISLDFGFGHAGNIIRFDQSKLPELVGYRNDFIWRNLTWTLELVYRHSSGIETALGYRRFIGNEQMPSHNILYYFVGLGYRFAKKPIQNQ